MPRVLLAALLVVVLTSTVAHAQLGTICIYADPSANQCNITDNPTITSVYVVHVETAGAGGVRYSAPVPACWTGAVWIADENQHTLVIGDSQTGVSVSYSTCLTGAVHVQTILLFSQGLSQPDCPYPILPHPDALDVEIADCNGTTFPGIGGTTHVNSTLPCECPSGLTGPVLSVSPTLVDFGVISTAANFNIANAGTGTLDWTVTESIPWLDASPPSGTNAGTVALNIDRTGLAHGHYTGVIDVSSNGGTRNVSVSMDVEILAPLLAYLGNGTLHFDATDNTLPVLIDNHGNADLIWNVTFDEPWLSASPPEGTIAPDGSIQAINVSIDRTGLPDGGYAQTLHITSNGGNQDVAVTADVYSGPGLDVAPKRLDFTPTVTIRTFDIFNIGVATLDWTLSADQPWIVIAPPLSGTGAAGVTVSVNPALIPPGDFVSGQVTVASNGGIETVDIVFIRLGAPGGVIGLYSDATGIDCGIYDMDGLVNVYVVHTATPGVAAIQFAAPRPDCMNATWLADTSPFQLVLGNSQTGAAIAYGGCVSTPVHVMTIQYLGTGTTAACCEYPVIPDPDAPTGTIEVVDCAQTRTFALSRSGYVNPDGSCPCGGTVKVETRTWGAVKALYLPPSAQDR